MSLERPLISVIMPVYNGERFLEEAIRSILSQTYDNYELILANDGSTDGSTAIIQSLLQSVPPDRIRVLDMPHQGLAETMNWAIRESRGKYIARMDQDDISLPKRLECQVRFLESHPDHVMCGSWAEVFTPSGKSWIVHRECNNEILQALLFAHCCFAPCVMIRREMFIEKGTWYRQEWWPADDYDLYIRMAEQGKVANIGKVLLRYRKHTDQVSSQINYRPLIDLLRKRQLLKLLPASTEQLCLHLSILYGRFKACRHYVDCAGKWLVMLSEENRRKRVYPEKYFNQLLQAWWYGVCRHALRQRQIAYKTYFNLPGALLRPEYGAKLLYHAYCARDPVA